MGHRKYGLAEVLIMAFDGALRGAQPPTIPVTTSPADNVPEVVGSTWDRQLSRRFMRVNHAGELSAQGLYLGQAAVARDTRTQQLLEHAAGEELAHLAWCQQRLDDLGGRPSRLAAGWYGGAYLLGALSGLVGDRWSLGFLLETERQVGNHLEDQLVKLPPDDRKSRAILLQMQRDEARHAATAQRHGAVPLPLPVTFIMRLQALVMKTIAARL